MTMPNSKWYPNKLCLIKYELDVKVKFKYKLFSIVFSPTGKYIGTSRIKQFKPRKTTISSTLHSRKRFQEYHYTIVSCNSGIDIFKWRVPLSRYRAGCNVYDYVHPVADKMEQFTKCIPRLPEYSG